MMMSKWLRMEPLPCTGRESVHRLTPYKPSETKSQKHETRQVW